MESVIAALDDALDLARLRNADGVATRSRQLSLAITKLEEARFWLLDADEHLKNAYEEGSHGAAQA